MIESNYEKLVHRYLRFAKTEKFSIWRLEQLINFGLGKENLTWMNYENIGAKRTDPLKEKFCLFV